MLQAAMLVLVAVLIVSATLHPQDQDKPPSPPAPVPAQRARGKKKPTAKQVNMCMHVCGFVCICMLAAADDDCDACDATAAGSGQASEPTSPREKRHGKRRSKRRGEQPSVRRHACTCIITNCSRWPTVLTQTQPRSRRNRRSNRIRLEGQPKSTIPRCARLYASVQFLYASACIYMHNYTLQQDDSNSDSDERAKQKKLEKLKQKKKKKKDDDDEDPEVCTSVRICTHLHASACICMHLYALNTPRFYITTALEALRESVLSRKCGSSS